jgi:glutamate-ammonia-ligase adenylyltransferase
MELAREEIKMLSTRRCRHFLAAIAPQLLKKISQTPAPDLTLENLAKTSRSLGGKGVLWELFSRHEPSMDLYVRLCGASPYLVSLLVNNPGMIDELLDSLMLNRLPDEHQLETMIYELCRGAEDIAPILASFKNAMHLNVGVREVLGKESIVDTHRALSDIADVCVNQVIENEYHNLIKKLGVPQTSALGACRFVFASIGKYGAREPNYHSDMGLLCLFESDGETAPVGISRRHIASSNHDFFQQLAQRVSQSLNRVGRFGKLYETKIWNLGNGRSSFLSWSLQSFLQAIESGSLSPEKRIELVDFRVFCGTREFVEIVEKQLETSLKMLPWLESDTLFLRNQRNALEATAHHRNLKRGYGGTIDIEWLCRTLVLRNADKGSITRAKGTAMLASHLAAIGVLTESESNFIIDSYRYLRGVESGLRLMNTAARHDLPQETIELERLAYILHVDGGKELESECDRFRSMNRKLFERYVQ